MICPSPACGRRCRRRMREAPRRRTKRAPHPTLSRRRERGKKRRSLTERTHEQVLIIAEHLDGKLNASTARCVTCAKDFKAESIDVLVLAADVGAIAGEAAKIDGVAKVLTVARAENAHALAAVYAPQVAAVAKNGYTHVLFPSTTFGKDVAPRVAALLGVAQVSDIMAVEGAHTFKRPIYAGNAIVTVEAPADKTLVGTVRTASYAAAGAGRERAGRSADTRRRAALAHAFRRTRSRARAIVRICKARRASSPADARSARPTTSRSSTRSPTSSALRSARRARRSMRATCRATCRSARPARSSRRSSTSRSASPARSSTSPASRTRARSSRSTRTPRRRSSRSPTIGLVGDLFKIVPELEQAV